MTDDWWLREFREMRIRLLALGVSEASARVDAKKWADEVIRTGRNNDTTQDDEEEGW